MQNSALLKGSSGLKGTNYFGVQDLHTYQELYISQRVLSPNWSVRKRWLKISFANQYYVVPDRKAKISRSFLWADFRQDYNTSF